MLSEIRKQNAWVCVHCKPLSLKFSLALQSGTQKTQGTFQQTITQTSLNRFSMHNVTVPLPNFKDISLITENGYFRQLLLLNTGKLICTWEACSNWQCSIQVLWFLCEEGVWFEIKRNSSLFRETYLQFAKTNWYYLLLKKFLSFLFCSFCPNYYSYSCL